MKFERDTTTLNVQVEVGMQDGQVRSILVPKSLLAAALCARVLVIQDSLCRHHGANG